LRNEQFIQYLKQPELLDQSSVKELKEIIDDYPFFPAARMLYLRNLRNINSYKFEQELAKHAIFIPDRALLYRLLDVQVKSDERFELLPYDEDAFKSFFKPKSGETEKTETKYFNYQVSDSFQLLDEEATPEIEIEKPVNDLIEQFIHGVIVDTPLIELSQETGKILSEQSNQIGEELITETLASVYLKQGLYSEALKSYEKLSLKFPEKNSYFATQIEKIKKLISKES
jgi:tetratricopeptide (TPR) repeat protein